MSEYKLYRKRFIPNEIVDLKDDILLAQTDDYLITSWNTLKPRGDIARGLSLYLIHHGVKISKIYDHQNNLLFWYCDIVTYEPHEEDQSLVVVDLLADVLIYPDGSLEIRDLDELADASDQGLITLAEQNLSLRNLNWLLTSIHKGEFESIQAPLNRYDSPVH